ncbi:MAG: hypothetical protein PHV37_05240 [Candidatus Gastranaerophilales bacterium]|nr:hypothetical protein [Candidatus Gastranaerophilales bacterium]
MKIAFTPSFGKVIPVKKIVINNDNACVNYEQITFDSYSGNTEKVDTSCSPDLSKKVIQALNRVLLRNDGAEEHTYKNALNNMIRNAFANVDNDYKIPAKPIPSSENSRIRPCYTGDRNYILTGKDAQDYFESGKNIGGARALVRDYNEDRYAITKSKRDFAYTKTGLIANPNLRLKNKYGNNLGIVIYADKQELPKKGKGTKTDITIKGIDFEPLELNR